MRHSFYTTRRLWFPGIALGWTRLNRVCRAFTLNQRIAIRVQSIVSTVMRHSPEEVARSVVRAEIPLSTEGFRIVVVDQLTDLDAHASAWNALCAAAQDPVPRHSYTFIQPFLALELKPGERWICLFAYAGDCLAGVMPLVIRPVTPSGLLQKLFLGSNKVELRGWTIVAAANHERAVADAFLQELARHDMDIFRFTFRALHEHSTIAGLQHQVSSVLPFRESCGQGAHLSVEGDFDSYLQSLSHHFRHNLRRWERLLSALPDVQFVVLTGEQVQDSDLDDFLSLEASGWKRQQGTAIACDPHKVTFYHTWLAHLRRAGWVELTLLKSGNTVLAGLFGIHTGRALVAWKIAYNEQFSQWAPGNVVMKHTIERAFRSGDIGEIDCLTSAEWMYRWGMRTRPYCNIYWYLRRPSSCLFGLLPMQARVLIQKIPGVHRLELVVRRKHNRVATDPWHMSDSLVP